MTTLSGSTYERTLLQIVQDVHDRLGLDRPTAVISGTGQVRQVFSLLLDEVGDAIEAHDWSKLRVTRSFTCAATQLQAEPPSNFFRLARGSDVWDITRRSTLQPVDAGEWTEINSQTSQPSYPQYIYMQGGSFYISKPALGDSMRYEYLAATPWKPSGMPLLSDWLPRPTADSDACILDATMLVYGTSWRFLRSKGLDYAQEFTDAERYRFRAIERDRGGSGRTISMDGARRDPARNRTWDTEITP
jgi:hypothetical protein